MTAARSTIIVAWEDTKPTHYTVTRTAAGVALAPLDRSAPTLNFSGLAPMIRYFEKRQLEISLDTAAAVRELLEDGEPKEAVAPREAEETT